MSRSTMLAAALLGLATSACSYSETTTRTAPPVAAAPVAVPAPVTTVYATPPATVSYAPAYTVPAYAPPPATTPPAGVQAFRDEYGFRYDGQGNRIDRYGNIISPQSTTP